MRGKILSKETCVSILFPEAKILFPFIFVFEGKTQIIQNQLFSKLESATCSSKIFCWRKYFPLIANMKGIILSFPIIILYT